MLIRGMRVSDRWVIYHVEYSGTLVRPATFWKDIECHWPSWSPKSVRKASPAVSDTSLLESSMGLDKHFIFQKIGITFRLTHSGAAILILDCNLKLAYTVCVRARISVNIIELFQSATLRDSEVVMNVWTPMMSICPHSPLSLFISSFW